MKTNLRAVMASVICVSLASAAEATVVGGTFSGLIYGGSTTSNAALAGTTVFGTFSYDSLYFELVSSGTTASTWVQFASSTPVEITATFGGNSFSFLGTQSGSLALNADQSGSSNPANRLNLGAVGFQDSLPAGYASGYVGLVVANNVLGLQLVTDLLDPGTVSFAEQSYPASSGEGSSICLQATNSGPGACIYFSMSSMSASPMVSSVPEPSTASLIGVGIGLMIAFRRRQSPCR